MAVIPEITCRRCGSKYSGLRNRCPKCGAPRINQPTRVPPTTAAATPQTAANGRAVSNIRWQFIFAGVLVLALILAVVVRRSTGKDPSSASAGSLKKPSAQRYIARRFSSYISAKSSRSSSVSSIDRNGTNWIKPGLPFAERQFI